MCAAPVLGFAEITNARRHPRSRPLFLNIVTIQASKAEPSAGSFSPGSTQAQAQGESCPRVSGDALLDNSNLYPRGGPGNSSVIVHLVRMTSPW